MKASLTKTVLLVVLLTGITPLGIARTTSQSASKPIEVKGEGQQKEKRSATLPIPITVSINNNQLIIDFLAPLGEVIVTISSESVNAQTAYYTVSSVQSILLELEGITTGEQCSIDFTTSEGLHCYGEFVME